MTNMQMQGLAIYCPKCGYPPRSIRLFLTLPMSNYKMGHKKLMGIECNKFYCKFSGTILDWLQIISK